MSRPNSRKNLDIALERMFDKEPEFLQFRRYFANAVAAQMLPNCVIKGGTSLKLRFGDSSTRFSMDLDTAKSMKLNDFIDKLEKNLTIGWNGFGGRVVTKKPAKPQGIPKHYVMQPFEIKLEYNHKPWITIPLEVGFNEIGDADEAEYVLPEDLIEVFRKLNFDLPDPVPVMKIEHQVAQKLHGLSEPLSKRVHDIVDLQLIFKRCDVDLRETKNICVRLFKFRDMQKWPPEISRGEKWLTLYDEAAVGLDVIDNVDDAIEWVNNLISKICKA